MNSTERRSGARPVKPNAKLRQALDEAVRCHRSGDRQGARAALGRALQTSPEHPDALHMLANLDGEDGDFAQAERHVTRALLQRRDFPPYLATLSRIQAATGRNEDAISSMSRSLQLEPTAARFNGMGLLLLNDDQPAKAMEWFERARELDHGNLDALVNLGVASFAAGLTRQAASYLEQALSASSGNSGIARRLGVVWQACGEHEQAIRALTSALQADPEDADLLTSLAVSYTALGEYDQAQEFFDRVLTRYPDYADALAGKAELLEWRGEYASGLQLLEPALQENRESPAVVTVYARLLRRTGAAKEGIELLRPLADSGRVQGAQLRQMRFTLGDLCDELGQYDEAFGWYQVAHEYRPNEFSAAEHRGFIDHLQQHFSAENFARLSDSGNDSQQPVFIVGMPRSGTSLAEQILAAHPEVHAGGERAQIGQSVQDLASRADPRGGELARHARAYLAELGTEALAARRITDKMPLNFLYLGWIAKLFPGARIIWCRRDYRDVGLSCYTTNFIDPALAFSDQLENIALYCNSCQELMEHWKRVLNLPIFDLHYEALVSDPENCVRDLLNAVELTWDPACLAFHKSERVVKTSSHAQVRQPFYTRSAGRWKNYQSHLQPLLDGLKKNE